MSETRNEQIIEFLIKPVKSFLMSIFTSVNRVDRMQRMIFHFEIYSELNWFEQLFVSTENYPISKLQIEIEIIPAKVKSGACLWWRCTNTILYNQTTLRQKNFWGAWIAEWYHTWLWSSVHCAMPWAMSSSIGDNKLLFKPKHSIYAFFMILFVMWIVKQKIEKKLFFKNF